MRKYLFIGLGGFFGASFRVMIKGADIFSNVGFPLSTLLINLSGTFLLAFFLTLTLKFFKIDEDLRLSLTVGFFGSFTTFSTFSKELSNLMLEGSYYFASFYLLSSIIFGLLLAFAGLRIASNIVDNLIQTEGEEI
ncbi:MAG: CrcB family protein [Sphaerochaetaceae bacterium]|nr:CrcB family protein [Sphaerochaetaceae bacterium]